MKKKALGFTIIELLFAIIILSVATIVFFTQKHDIEVKARDDQRKTAINAMYYSLEKVFYEQNKYYPESIDSDNLKSMDPSLFADPDNKKIGSEGSSYSYTATNCESGQCKSYTLKASLENESDYSKSSPKH